MGNDNWKAELGALLAPQPSVQAESCEAAFVRGMTEDAQELALLLTDKLLARSKTWIDCRLGAGTPQAQAAFGDLSAIVSKCATQNLLKLLTGGWQAYAAAVLACVTGSLMGGGPVSNSGFQERSVARCGDQR